MCQTSLQLIDLPNHGRVGLLNQDDPSCLDISGLFLFFAPNDDALLEVDRLGHDEPRFGVRWRVLAERVSVVFPDPGLRAPGFVHQLCQFRQLFRVETDSGVIFSVFPPLKLGML